MNVATQRLHNQHLVGTPLDTPTAVVAWLCAVQAQDYGASAWGLAQRTAGADCADVDRAFDEGSILRTHVLRPTWHFVRPDDIRWLLALTAPRVHRANAYMYRALELDDDAFARSADLLANALRDGRYRTRKELTAVLEDGGITASGQRLAYLLMHAELDALVCSGPRRGKQFTYALLDERAPHARTLPREDALAELSRRYLASHGPATVHDFAWWSGLSVADARAGFRLLASDAVQKTVDGIPYWRTASAPAVALEEPVVHLLPNFDEHVIAYRDHSASLDPAALKALARGYDAFRAHLIALNGRVIGGWRRTLETKQVVVRTTLLIDLSPEERAALDAAAEAYGRFMGLPVTLDIG